MNDDFKVKFSTRVLIQDDNTNEVLVDKSNAVHPQNMARVIARGLANEPNSTIYRIAFGNGGSFVDIGGNIVLNAPNDGTGGEGLDSRLYNETYSELLYDDGTLLSGTDPGSFGPDGVRIGGGHEEGSEENTISSQEVGRKSNVIVNAVLSNDEPNTQLANDPNVIDADEVFSFDELGFYSSGGPSINTSGYQRIFVGDNINSDSQVTGLSPNGTYIINVLIDGNPVPISETINVPSSGTGTLNTITFGDLCEGINTGAWLSGGASSPLVEALKVSITDRSSQNYDTISGANTFGYLLFESKTSGSSSLVSLQCDSGNPNDILNVWGCTSIDPPVQGQDAAGVNERERLLTHITFPPILKKSNRAIRIIYTLTVSVAQVDETIVEANLV